MPDAWLATHLSPRARAFTCFAPTIEDLRIDVVNQPDAVWPAAAKRQPRARSARRFRNARQDNIGRDRWRDVRPRWRCRKEEETGEEESRKLGEEDRWYLEIQSNLAITRVEGGRILKQKTAL